MNVFDFAASEWTEGWSAWYQNAADMETVND
jgi:hypothetical protein